MSNTDISNKNTGFFEALQKVEDTQPQTTVSSNNQGFMSVADMFPKQEQEVPADEQLTEEELTEEPKQKCTIRQALIQLVQEGAIEIIDIEKVNEFLDGEPLSIMDEDEDRETIDTIVNELMDKFDYVTKGQLYIGNYEGFLNVYYDEIDEALNQYDLDDNTKDMIIDEIVMKSITPTRKEEEIGY